MRALQIVLCFCCFLLGGWQASAVSFADVNDLSTTIRMEKEHQVIAAHGVQYLLKFSSTHAPDFKWVDIDDDLEDEHFGSITEAKYELQSCGIPQPSCPTYVFILKHPSNCFSIPPPETASSPDLRILQGVFRI